MLRPRPPVPSNLSVEMSGGVGDRGRIADERSAAGAESGAPFANDFYGFGSARPSSATSWKDDEHRPSSSSSGRLEPDRPRYLWEQIPPRLASAAEDEDLLELPSEDDDFDVDVDYDPAPSCSTSWWDAATRSQEERRPNPFNRLSVSINTGCGTDVERRPLHHSGGGVASSGTSQQIDIGLPTADPPSRIQLEISGCSSSLTVSVTTKCDPAPISRPSLLRGCVDPARVSLRRGAEPFCTPQPAVEQTQQIVEDDQKVLARALRYLKDSGWYYAALSSQQAQLCLQGTPEGTFLARDSLHEKFVFALSVQTAHGPTSVRIQLAKGRFKLDAPAELTVPTFSDINLLVEHYSRKGPFAVDGLPSLMMRLRKPLLKQAPSLQHLCRLTLNKLRSTRHEGSSNSNGTNASVERKVTEVLPPALQQYLDQYPYIR